MSVKTLLTLEDFLQLPDDDDMRHELDAGELITMPPTKMRHGDAQDTIGYLLTHHVRRFRLGKIVPTTGFLLFESPPTVFAPDLAFLTTERVAQASPDEYTNGAPNLAIEIISPSNTPAQMARKVREYFRAGAHSVWVVYPAKREVHVFDGPDAKRVLRGDDVIDCPALLPGFSAKVSAFFR